MSVADLLQWWNLIFVLPFCAALGYVLLLSTGAVAAEGLGDHDIDIDHDVNLDVDQDIGIDAGHALGLDLSDAPDAGFWANALTLLGVGKAPLSVIVTCFCFIWGFSGWASNEVFRSVLPAPALFIWPSMGVALVAALLLTRFIVLGMTKLLPLDENFAVADAQLVGRRAKARFSITPTSGTAQLNDQYGNLHEVSCRLKSNEGEVQSLPPGTPIILLDYDREKKLFYVRVDPLENSLGNEKNRRALP